MNTMWRVAKNTIEPSAKRSAAKPESALVGVGAA
jgi:hypothetical protein